MNILTVEASIPAWTMATLRKMAGDRSIHETLGFGLMIAMNVDAGVRRDLADTLTSSADDEREIVAVQFAGGDRWPADDMPLAEVVQLAAAIVAIAEHDPQSRADFLRLMHGDEELQ